MSAEFVMRGIFASSPSQEPSRSWVAAGKRLIVQSAFGTFAVALITMVCFIAHLNYLTPSLLYLLVVVFQSLSTGYASAAIVSVIAAACLEYYFIPPVLTWRINSPEDGLALFTYLVTSLVITRLASSARNQTRIAESKREDVALLYRTASRLLSLEPEIAAGPRALRIFREGFGLNAASLFDASTASMQIDGQPEHGLIQETRNTYESGKDYRDAEGLVHVHCLLLDGKPVGAVGFEGRFEDEAAVRPLFALAATAFERALSFRNAAKASAAAQAEMLRSAILDAFAHEVKTPQAVIMAAAGSLRETGGLRADQVEMTDVIESEVTRMNRLTTRLLRMARIDRGEVSPNLEITSLEKLLAHLIGQYRGNSGGHKISIRPRRVVPNVLTDPELMSLALVQLLDNACKYSNPGTPVMVELDCDGAFAEVFVTNEGGHIRDEESERVFERFYRGTETEHTSSGAGLGLYVARKIVRAHGGDLELYRNQSAPAAEAEPPRGNGAREFVKSANVITTFRVKLPIAQQEAQDE